MKLSQAKIGDRVKITSFACENAYKNRLKTLGVKTGAQITVEHVGHTVIISYKGRLIAIGQELAESVEVI